MSIATRKGDAGETSLMFGKRVSKTHARVWAYGTVDELNSAIGLSYAHSKCVETRSLIRDIQGVLVLLMGELACDNADQPRYFEKAKRLLDESDLEIIDQHIAKLEADSGKFKGWSYPGNTQHEAFFDHARSTCRRAERYAVGAVEEGHTIRPIVLKYLNRLADLCWLLAREHA